MSLIQNMLLQLHHVSASSLKTYNQCPYKFAVQSYCGVKSPDTIYTIKGKDVHAVVERYLNRWMARKKNAQLSLTLHNYKRPTNTTLAKQALHTLDGHVILGAEMDFLLYIDRNTGDPIILPSDFVPQSQDYLLVKGVMDAVTVDGCKLCVSDWKTGKFISQNAFMADLQQKVYSIVAYLLGLQYNGCSVTFRYLEESRVVSRSIEVTFDYMKQCVKDVLEVAETLDCDTLFYPKRGWYCSGCVANGVCGEIYRAVGLSKEGIVRLLGVNSV